MNVRVIFSALLALAILALLSTNAGAQFKNPCPTHQCGKLKQQIEHTQSLMRQGHSNAAGKRYRARLKRLRDSQREFCRR